ncbi:hypothetical protein KSP39_PZI000922 [Platanthera zijinensis]|uniref:Translation initiation factor 3 N-terminal domain-containing protein n=1 Tax=Platanthera zijinensis TaxID=2320716 RepID=A0AAP0GGM2_9ASPA
MKWYFSGGGIGDLRGFRTLEAPFSQSNPICCYTSFRSFMTSGQAKQKPKLGAKGGDWRSPKVEDDVGIRINEAIKEREVRLVTDQGHRIVSIQEALFLARRHDLDLVEVQRKVKVEVGLGFKPAVCKLMDYSKEKYKQDVKGKEKAKSLATNTLRNGENKEVRFKGKTELKDLKLKAETVKRLMERGYRVKCTAMHTGKDDEDLGALLLNLLELIEDISVVESGPHLDTKNAFVIVKHIKFTSKKGKVSKAMETVKSILRARPTAASDASSADKDDEDSGSSNKDENSTTEAWETVESDSENEIKGPSKQPKPNNQQLDDIEANSNFNLKHASSNSGRTTHIPLSRAPEQPDQSNRYSQGSNGAFSAQKDGVFPEKFAPGNRWRVNERNCSNGNHGLVRLNPMDRPPRTYNPDSSSLRPAHTYNPDSSSPRRYGIFSAPKTISSDDQMKLREKSSNGSPPSPRFGSFTSSKKTSSP